MHDKQHSPLYQTKNRNFIEKYFVKSLTNLIWEDVVGSTHKLDFDPLCDAESENQNITKLAVGKSVIKDEKASVLFAFNNFDKKKKFNYIFTKENNSWKIENIIYADNTSLAGFFKNWFPQ